MLLCFYAILSIYKLDLRLQLVVTLINVVVKVKCKKVMGFHILLMSLLKNRNGNK